MDKINEKDLLEKFSSIEKLTKEWEKLYPGILSPKNSKEEDIVPPMIEPIFIHKIHASC